MRVNAEHIAALLQGEIEGDPQTAIKGPSGIESAGKEHISFLGNLKYESHLYTTQAGVVIVPQDLKLKQPVTCTLIKVKDVYQSLAILFQAFAPKISLSVGVAESAILSAGVMVSQKAEIGNGAILEEGAIIDDDVKVGAQVYIGRNVSIGKGSIVYPGVKILDGCKIGRNCIIHCNAVIGSDGFGFARDHEGRFMKIPQLGNVVIGDHVEIGSNCTIDRGSLGDTVIDDGVKIDNLVHVAHNVRIGKNTAIAAQTGIAGSSKLGSDCLIGGQVGIAGHIEIPAGSQIQAQSGVAGTFKQNGIKLFGSPAIEYNKYLKSYSVFKQLPELAKKIERLEKMLKDKLT